MNTEIMQMRELFNKSFVIQSVVPDTEIWDLDLNLCTVEDLPKVIDLIAAPTTVFSWIKGNKVTLFITKDATAPRYAELLNILGINVKVSAKTMKRMARMFSDRDVVVTLPSNEVNIEMVAGDEFTRHIFTNPDDIDALQDGMMAISYSFVRKLLKLAGLNKRILDGAEALSFSAVTPDGFIKALAYIVADADMPVDGADVVTCGANIKSELRTSNDMVHIAMDIFRPYSDPKTNIQTDIMLREILGNQDLDVKLLADTLTTKKNLIVNGDFRKAMEDWTMKSLESKIDGNNKVNDDFAHLADIAEDIHARGGDYRDLPSVITMMGTGIVNQYYNLKGNWAKYPLPCAWSRPIISESGACLIGEDVDVERGTIRSIRHGDVWVVNDQDYIEFFRTNAGGADLDDHFMLIFRLINGIRSVIVGRIPMGWREFSVFTFVDGDEYPTYTSSTGKVTEFPAINKEIPKTLHELMEAGEMRITGVGEFTPLTYPLTYGPEAVTPIVTELLSGELGYVGAIINSVMVAAATKPEMLNEMPASMEGIIDAFTQGGGVQVRQALSEYGEALLEELDVHGNTIDTKFLGKGGRVGPKNFKHAMKVNGIYTVRDQQNKAVRAQVLKEINAFGQQYNRLGNPLLNKMLSAFHMTYWDVQNTTDPMFVQVRRAQSAFNGHIAEMTKANMERARMIANETGRAMEPISISAEQWTTIYNTHLERLNKIANNDPEMLKMVSIINWMVCMVVRTSKGEITDRSIMNKVMWPIWIQATVKYGFLMDLDMLTKGGNPWNTSFELTCSSCGIQATTKVDAFIRFERNGHKCRKCS